MLITNNIKNDSVTLSLKFARNELNESTFEVIGYTVTFADGLYHKYHSIDSLFVNYASAHETYEDAMMDYSLFETVMKHRDEVVGGLTEREIVSAIKKGIIRVEKNNEGVSVIRIEDAEFDILSADITSINNQLAEIVSSIIDYFCLNTNNLGADELGHIICVIKG